MARVSVLPSVGGGAQLRDVNITYTVFVIGAGTNTLEKTRELMALLGEDSVCILGELPRNFVITESMPVPIVPELIELGPTRGRQQPKPFDRPRRIRRKA